jgi:signal transduction histidine kinase
MACSRYRWDNRGPNDVRRDARMSHCERPSGHCAEGHSCETVLSTFVCGSGACFLLGLGSRFAVDGASLIGTTSEDSPTRRFNILAALAAAGVGACAAAVAITLSGNQSTNPGLDAEIRAAIIAAPTAVGLYAWNREPWARFGKLLVAAGFAWSLTTLAQSNNEVLYSAGRVFGWLVEPFLIYLVLAFPSGRLTARSDRLLLAASVVLVGLLYLPTALLVDSYPSPSQWSSCNTDCPGNAFMLLGSQPGFVKGLLIPLREVGTTLLFAGVIAVLVRRVWRGTRLMRITLLPVLAFAILHAAAIIVGLAARRAAPHGLATEVSAWAIAISVPGMALGFLVGLLRWRRFENGALRRLSSAFAAHPPALSLRETSELLCEGMDPSLKILHRSRNGPDAWLDVEDKRALPVAREGVDCITEISADDGSVVALVHDASLRSSPTFLDVARASVLKALENERLGSELRRSLRELRESRARIMSSADRERQRIEHNLHDGAQQSLVALRIRLELAGELLHDAPDRVEELLSALVVEVDEALDEVRSLASGVYPSLLADRGLSDALRAAARRNPVPTTVETEGIGRYRPEVEAAIYFCCLEAIQNAMKHAAGVETISVSIAEQGEVRFEVHDDGSGFAEHEVTSGAGLANMHDRLAAVGGVLSIDTSLGSGTTVSGVIPVTHHRRASEEARATGSNGYHTLGEHTARQLVV